MKSDVISVTGRDGIMEAALRQVDKVAAYKELSARGALHLRLLTEEMMALVRAITGSAQGEFWIQDENGVYELHLKVVSLVDGKMREQLLSASSSGKNEAARGFMGKIRTFFDPCCGVSMFATGFPGGGATQMYENCTWRMEDYRNQLREYSELNREDSREAWDELEKAVVAKVADDVKVSIQGRTVEMTIVKKLA